MEKEGVWGRRPVGRRSRPGWVQWPLVLEWEIALLPQENGHREKLNYSQK